jgi:hypothetical protein
MGEWRYSSTILVLRSRWKGNSQVHALDALTPGERAFGIHWIGGRVGFRGGLDAVEKREISWPCRKSLYGQKLRLAIIDQDALV